MLPTRILVFLTKSRVCFNHRLWNREQIAARPEFTLVVLETDIPYKHIVPLFRYFNKSGRNFQFFNDSARFTT